MRDKFKVQSSQFKVQSRPTLNFEPGTLNIRRRRAFTLTELLIVIMIIGIMAGLALSALAGATELAREQRTRAIINKLDQLIMERYEEYRTRAVPIRVAVGNNPRQAALIRLNALRELMRLELPDRISDLCTLSELNDLQSGDNTLNAIANLKDAIRVSNLTAIPSVARSYKRRAAMAIATSGSGWSSSHQGAECLYLIVGSMQDGDKSALDFFSPSEIGDTDEDGMKEILDGWGTPIEFLRWAPAFTIENGALTKQTSSFAMPPNRVSPDPFDPAKVDPRATSIASTACFALYPLIYSAGRDKAFDIDVGSTVYAQTANNSIIPNIPPNDPYYGSGGAAPLTGASIGTGFNDNITNHYQETP